MRAVWPLLAGFGIAFGESGLGIGMLLPGETAIVVLAATQPSWQLAAVLGLLVALGACLGDHVGYLLGRRYGTKLRDTRAVRRVGVRHFDRAMDLLRRRGAVAVLGTRLLPVLRTLTPAAAGAAGLRYPAFVAASFAGSCTWAAVYVGGGSLAGALVDAAGGALGRGTWLLLLAVVLLLVPLLAPRVRAATAAARASHDRRSVAPVARGPVVTPRVDRTPV